MASIFKTFLNNDIVNSRTLLHEAIPMTGSIVSGSYGTWRSETNIKNYSHGMWQSVYDYAYLSSSANHVFDITAGFASDSALSQSSPGTQQVKKINLYNTMAQTLMGHDHTGSILPFDEDGNILAGGTKLKECFFLNFSRLLHKDEIKKGSFTIEFGKEQAFAAAIGGTKLTLTDNGAQNDYRVNSPTGEYGILSASTGEGAGSTSGRCGLIFYQAGVAVITASVFMTQPTGKIAATAQMDPAGSSIESRLQSTTIQNLADEIRHRIYNISFNNTTELHSTVYFCRLNHNEFNYSANPTYVSSSKIQVKNSTLDEPVTYITTVGLYDSENALLAVGKLSEPLKKTSSNSLTLRVRLDY